MNNRADIVKELTELNSALKDMPADTPYQAPEGYFDTLSNRLTTRVSAQTSNTYDVPEGYFSSLPQTILEKAKQTDTKQKTKTVDFPVSWGRFKLAAAAAILFFLSIGAFQMIDSAQVQPITVADKLENIPDNLLLAYVEDHIDDYEMTLLETTNINNTTATEKSTTIDEVSEDVINDYLNTNGWN